jgi:hypothetical protein
MSKYLNHAVGNTGASFGGKKPGRETEVLKSLLIKEAHLCLIKEATHHNVKRFPVLAVAERQR